MYNAPAQAQAIFSLASICQKIVKNNRRLLKGIDYGLHLTKQAHWQLVASS